LAKTSQEALLFALDAFALKVGLVTKVEASAPTVSAPSLVSEVAIPDFAVAEMPAAAPGEGEGGEAGQEWPEDPFPPAPPAAYGLADEEEPTNERRKV
jgi:hypothetical protein